MINWRKPLIYLLSFLQGSKRMRYYHQFLRYEQLPLEKIANIQSEKLTELLMYAYENVPYYKSVLKEAGVVVDCEVDLEKFHKVPVLTKEILRSEGERLLFRDYKNRKTYQNTSGGSTGEPVKFIQDREYLDWNIAYKMFIRHTAGQDIGMREIRLWGSERDILEGHDSIKKRVENYLFNRVDLNSFRMTDKDMYRFVEKWNRHKPTWVEAYVQSIYEFTKFLDKKNLDIYKPKAILTSAGVLSEDVKDFIENFFKCPIVNRYGSREVGDMAFSYPYEDILRINNINHFIELLNEELEPVPEGEFGEVYITLLTNYSMPLIRYKIGDMAVLSSELNKFGSSQRRAFKKIVGRNVNLFYLRDGTRIDGEYFSHIFYFKDWVKKFQIIQEDYDNITVKVVLEKDKSNEDIQTMEEAIKKVMGSTIKIKWQFVNKILPSKSGKYLYTISKLNN